MRRLARMIGDFQARVLLAAFYYTLLAPFALAARFGGHAPEAGWRRREGGDADPRRQY